MLHVLVAGEPFEAAEWFDLAGLPPALRPAFETTGTLVRASGPGVFGVGGHVAVVLPRCFSGAVDDAAQLAAAGHTVRVLRRYADDRSTQSSVLEDKLQIERPLPATSHRSCCGSKLRSSSGRTSGRPAHCPSPLAGCPSTSEAASTGHGRSRRQRHW
jgi:hypothetical protein